MKKRLASLFFFLVALPQVGFAACPEIPEKDRFAKASIAAFVNATRTVFPPKEPPPLGDINPNRPDRIEPLEVEVGLGFWGAKHRDHIIVYVTIPYEGALFRIDDSFLLIGNSKAPVINAAGEKIPAYMADDICGTIFERINEDTSRDIDFFRFGMDIQKRLDATKNPAKDSH